MDDLTGLLLWGGLRLTWIVKTNSPCLSSHDEDVNTFQFQQANICIATLLFQPQLITTQMIIYKLSVCCFTHIIHRIVVTREMQEIFRCAHNNKRPHFTEPFLIRSVRRKRDHFRPSFLPSPLVLSHLNTDVISCFFRQWQQVYDKMYNLSCITSILAPNVPTRWYLSSLCFHWEKSCTNILRWFLYLYHRYIFLRTSTPKIKLQKGVQYNL